MGKLATLTAPTVTPTAKVRSRSKDPDTVTAEGGEGFSRKPKSELFLLAVTNMVGEQTFYEAAGARDERFRELIAKVAAKDPDWVARFVPYLRDTMNLRSAAVVMAAELVHAKLTDKVTGTISNRAIVASALVRADEPAEMVGYWVSRYGRNLPQPVKRGIADAVRRLYNERAFLKYGAGKGYRMADVLDLVHPTPIGPWQAALFTHMLDDRHGRAEPRGLESLPMVAARKALETVETRTADAETFASAGATWEWASAWYGRKLDTAFWEALIPSMGYMALLRNLRNFDEAGVPDAVAKPLADWLSDPAEVAKSRQLPLRFVSAYKAAPSLRWSWALEQAIGHSLQNVPSLTGKTLILVDCSGSMDSGVSAKSELTRRQAAALFGAALALRAQDATLIGFADTGVVVPVPKGGSVLPLALAAALATSGGTRTIDVLAATFSGHDRVVILTDEQAFAPDGQYVGAFGGFTFGPRSVKDTIGHITVPIYTFNLAGYQAGHLASGNSNRYTFGGLTDAGFRAIELLDRGTSADWPF